jgi:hypothetical protein
LFSVNAHADSGYNLPLPFLYIFYNWLRLCNFSSSLLPYQETIICSPCLLHVYHFMHIILSLVFVLDLCRRTALTPVQLRIHRVRNSGV